MSCQWNVFSYDPTPTLLSSKNPAIIYFTQRDVQCKSVPPVSTIWKGSLIEKILKKQQSNGSWKFPGKQPVKYPPHHYALVQTWKELRILVKQYEMNKKHPAIERACEYIYSCQSKDGDIRGMIGNQYATYYTGAMLGVLQQAGYTDDLRLEKGLQWLLSMRQNDGGWTIPILTRDFSKDEQNMLTSTNVPPVQPDRSKPFSHNWTDMVLRGFAQNPKYQQHKDILAAAELLKSRFFQSDSYGSYHSAEYWFRFEFWWANLLTSLETLVLLGLSKNDTAIHRALQWFVENQQESGLWKTNYIEGKTYTETPKTREKEEWLTLRICRVFKQFYS